MPASQAPQAKWIIGERNDISAQLIANEFRIHPLAAAVMVQRGYSELDEAERFLNPRLEDLHSPTLLPDYRAAADAILGARERGEIVYVHGDYDVDGVTSAALFTRFLKRIGINVIPHVPHRMKEGYGIHVKAVHWAKEHGADLFLTCDCGANAHEQLELVRELGMKAVVTDHHELGESLPHALAVVNPHRKDSTYPFPELCGVGIVLKLCAGLSQELGHDVSKFYRAFLDLAVLGTVADVMPLVGENRIITKHGLKLLRETKKPGLRALLSVCDLAGESTVLSSRDIGFGIGPRINAVGRISDASIALDLLLSEDYNEALKIARDLDNLNTERRTEQAKMVDEAIEMISEIDLARHPVLVIGKEGWHPGIIGIVAGKLVETYHRPAMVMGIGEDGIAKGSARSIPGFHLADAINAHRHILLGGGGHELAAGFSLNGSDIADFCSQMTQYGSTKLSPEDLVPRIKADMEIQAAEGTILAANSLKLLEPFGEANVSPVFACRRLTIEALRPTRKPEHVGLTVSSNGHLVSAMAFGFGEEISNLPIGTEIDATVEFDSKPYQGKPQFKWILRNYQVSES